MLLQHLTGLTVFLGLLGSCFALPDKSVTIYAWPMSAKSPEALATITYNEAPLSKPILSDFRVPKLSENEKTIRVGLYDPATKDWRGVATSPNSFDPKYQQLLTLHVDDGWAPWHIDFSAYPMPEAMQKTVRMQSPPPESVPQAIVELITPKPGPAPHLNKPVILRPDGKADEKEPEKTFLQKYWWIIGIFLLIQVLSAGSGGKE